MHNIRVEICGNIASGKTTLARAFAKAGYASIEETFLRNPFIKKFYQNPKLYSFETEISFLLQHYHSIKCEGSNSLFFCDFSLNLDEAYADVTLSPSRRKHFSSLLHEIIKEIGNPAMIIYLKCSKHVLLDRIRGRGRKFEASISTNYLDDLSKAINKKMEAVQSSVPIVEIDSTQIDFRNDISEIVQQPSVIKILNQ